MRLALVLTVIITAGCGGSSSTPTAPSPTPTPTPSPTTNLILLTLAAPEILAGQTTTASATATLSDGTTQPVTTGFLSDQPTVASVSQDGTVTGVSNGRASIFVISGGRQGQQVIRVYPDYRGTWTGTATVTQCSDSLQFEGFCDTDFINIGDTFVVAMGAAQALGAVTVFGQWAGVNIPTSTVQVAGNGSIEFAGRGDLGDFSYDQTWRVNAASPTRFSGTIVSVLTVSRVTGGASYTSVINGLTGGALSTASGSAGPSFDTDAARRFLAR